MNNLWLAWKWITASYKLIERNHEKHQMIWTCFIGFLFMIPMMVGIQGWLAFDLFLYGTLVSIFSMIVYLIFAISGEYYYNTLLEMLCKKPEILLQGEAGSHCVANTIRDMASNLEMGKTYFARKGTNPHTECFGTVKISDFGTRREMNPALRNMLLSMLEK